MSVKSKNVANLLRENARKMASAGAPDRMTNADGNGGTTVQAGSVKYDPGQDAIKKLVPGTPTLSHSFGGGSAPDRMTAADGNAPLTVQGATPKYDQGEGEVKDLLPSAPDTPTKSAHERVAAIKNLLAPTVKSANPQYSYQQPQMQQAYAPQHQGPQLDVSQSMLAKVASDILSTEEGILFTHRLMEKQAGAQVARARIQEVMQAASHRDTVEQIKSAAFHNTHGTAIDIYNRLDELGVTEDDCDLILKQASIHQNALAEIDDNVLLKMAYAQATEDAAAMEDAETQGIDAEAGAVPMSDEEGLSEEELLALIEQAIDSGAISPEELEAAIAQMEDEGGEGEEGGYPQG